MILNHINFSLRFFNMGLYEKSIILNQKEILCYIKAVQMNLNYFIAFFHH